MSRCFDLAEKAGKEVKSNPKVGALLVHGNRIIGEGYHKNYGGPHAEINALASVRESDKKLIPDSTMYVSLEPCCITGKTPPCTDAILANGIRKVVISVSDPNELVDGSSIQILRSKGVQVVTGILEDRGRQLIRPFKANLEKRPYVILKWAQSRDAYIGKKGQQVWLSNQYSKLKTHKWRSEIDGIMVGHNTALVDNPQLTTRLVKGDNPLRIVLSNRLNELNKTKIYNGEEQTIFFGNEQSPETSTNKHYFYDGDTMPLNKLLNQFYDLGVYTLMVEGGKKTLQKFIDNNCWDEARIIKTPFVLQKGIRAPSLSGQLIHKEIIHNDLLEYVIRR